MILHVCFPMSLWTTILYFGSEEQNSKVFFGNAEITFICVFEKSSVTGSRETSMVVAVGAGSCEERFLAW